MAIAVLHCGRVRKALRVIRNGKSIIRTWLVAELSLLAETDRADKSTICQNEVVSAMTIVQEAGPRRGREKCCAYGK